MQERKTVKKFSKREGLIQAAMDEFAENDFDQASLNNILQNSDVGKGTFYYHFSDKTELYLTVIDRLIHMKKRFLKGKEAALKGDEDIFTFLYVQGSLSAEFVLSDPRIQKLSLRIPREPNKKIREAASARTGARTEDFLNPLVEKARKKGELRDDMPIRFQTKLLAFLFNNFATLFQEQKNYSQEGQEQVLLQYNYYMDFIKNGLGKTS